MPFFSPFFIMTAMAVIVQFLVDVVKKLLPKTALRCMKPPLLSLIISLALVFMFELDLFAAFGWMSRVTWLAYLFTALAISAGADPLHNLFAKIRESRGAFVK